MAGGMDLGTRAKGARSLDVAINVVPFIDLMAVTISFLLLTAVWTQAGQLPVGASGAESKDATANAQPPVHLAVSQAGVTVRWDDARVASVSAPLDTSALRRQLREISDASAGGAPILLHAEDTVAYEQVVTAVDACLGAGLADVTIETGQ